MAKKRKKTSVQLEYNKQIKRIKNFIRRAEKRGFKFDENIIPKKPKRITESSVNKLKRLTPEKLYSKSVYGGVATNGEIVKGLEGRILERKYRKSELKTPTQESTNTPGFEPPENISNDPSFFDNVVISGFKQHVSQFNERASNLLLSWLERILSTNDIHDVATMLNDGAEAGNIVTYQIVYSTDKLHEYMSNMLEYLPEAGDFFKSEMMDAFEMEEDYSEPS